MKGFLAGLLGWFKGKKTIFGGGLVMAAAVAGVWYGKLNADSALALLGIGLSIAGAASKANRHQAELLTALQGVAQIGADARAGKSVAGDLAAVATTLTPALAGEAVSLGGASLHLSASTMPEVLEAVTKLTANGVQGTTVGTTVVNNTTVAGSPLGPSLMRLLDEQAAAAGPAK